MTFYATVIGGWYKLEIFEHYDLLLLGLLFLVCVLEVILLKLALIIGLFSRENSYNSEYRSFEDNIYHEHLRTNNDNWTLSPIFASQRQQSEEQQLLPHSYAYYDSHNNELYNSSTTTAILHYL